MNVSISASAIQNNYARDLNDLHMNHSFIHYIMAIKLHFQANNLHLHVHLMLGSSASGLWGQMLLDRQDLVIQIPVNIRCTYSIQFDRVASEVPVNLSVAN